jgi:hypothetical protein
MNKIPTQRSVSVHWGKIGLAEAEDAKKSVQSDMIHLPTATVPPDAIRMRKVSSEMSCPQAVACLKAARYGEKSGWELSAYRVVKFHGISRYTHICFTMVTTTGGWLWPWWPKEASTSYSELLHQWILRRKKAGIHNLLTLLDVGYRNILWGVPYIPMKVYRNGILRKFKKQDSMSVLILCKAS